MTGDAVALYRVDREDDPPATGETDPGRALLVRMIECALLDLDHHDPEVAAAAAVWIMDDDPRPPDPKAGRGVTLVWAMRELLDGDPRQAVEAVRSRAQNPFCGMMKQGRGR